MTKYKPFTEDSVTSLSHLADVAFPANSDSPGAQWLREVRDALAETVDYDQAEFGEFDPDSDRLNELTDGAISVYTAERWEVFTELRLWDETGVLFISGDMDMTDLAGYAQEIVARRLMEALLDEWEVDDEAEEVSTMSNEPETFTAEEVADIVERETKRARAQGIATAVQRFTDSLPEAIRQARHDAWDEGFTAADERVEDILAGEPVDPIVNPYAPTIPDGQEV